MFEHAIETIEKNSENHQASPELLKQIEKAMLDTIMWDLKYIRSDTKRRQRWDDFVSGKRDTL